MFEKIKDTLARIPMPVWIGIAITVVVAVVVTQRSAQQAATIGVQAGQASAGSGGSGNAGVSSTDLASAVQSLQTSEASNLATLTQQIQDEITASNQANATALQQGLASTTDSFGSAMSQLGATLTSLQQQIAALNHSTQQAVAPSGATGPSGAGAAPSGGQVLGSTPGVGSTSLYTVSLPGGGSINVNASDPAAAIANAKQQTPSLNW